MAKKKQKRRSRAPPQKPWSSLLRKGELFYRKLERARERIARPFTRVDEPARRLALFVALGERRGLLSGELDMAAYRLEMIRRRKLDSRNRLSVDDKLRTNLMKEIRLVFRLRVINARILEQATGKGMGIYEFVGRYAGEEMELVWLDWPGWDGAAPVWEKAPEVEMHSGDEEAMEMCKVEMDLQAGGVEERRRTPERGIKVDCFDVRLKQEEAACASPPLHLTPKDESNNSFLKDEPDMSRSSEAFRSTIRSQARPPSAAPDIRILFPKSPKRESIDPCNTVIFAQAQAGTKQSQSKQIWPQQCLLHQERRSQ